MGLYRHYGYHLFKFYYFTLTTSRNMKAQALLLIVILQLSSILAQDCQAQLDSITGQLNSVQGQFDNIKKAVKIVSIVLPILGGLLLILLGVVIYLLVKAVLKIKRKLPIPKDWGFIRFLRNLGKSVEKFSCAHYSLFFVDKLDLNAEVNLTLDVEKKVCNSALGVVSDDDLGKHP